MGALNNKCYKRILLTSILIVFFCYFSLWALTIPFDGAPDEELRYMLPSFIYKHWKLPTGYDSEVIYPVGYYSYAFYPQLLGAIVSAFFMKIHDLLPIKFFELLFFARLTSIASGLGIVYVIGKTSERITQRFSMRILAMVIVATWPQLTFLSAYVNNDIIGLLGVALVLDVLIHSIQTHDWIVRRTFQVFWGYLFCLLGYMNTYPLVLFSSIYFLCRIDGIRKKKKYNYLWLINHSLLLMVLLSLTAAPFFLRNYMLYHDIFGNRIFEHRYQLWLHEGHPQTLFPFTEGHLVDLLVFFPFWESVVKSFIGVFGYMSFPMIRGEYSRYLVAIGVGFIGFLIKCFRSLKSKVINKEIVRVILVQLLSCLFTVALFIYRSYTTDYQAQGRYIIPVIVSLLVMVIIGYNQIISFLTVKKRNIAVGFLISLWLIQGLLVYYNYIYYNHIVLDLVR